MAEGLLLQSCGRQIMWTELLDCLRGLEPTEREIRAREMLEVAQVILNELAVEWEDPSQRSSEFCGDCPFVKICDR